MEFSPLEISAECNVYDIFERYLLDSAYYSRASMSSLFKRFVEGVRSDYSAKLTTEFELYSSFIPKLKANFPLLTQQDDFKIFCVGISSPNEMKKHIKRLAKKAKVENFLCDCFLEKMKVFSMCLFICRIYSPDETWKVQKYLTDTCNYLEGNDVFYSSILDLYYSILNTSKGLPSFLIDKGVMVEEKVFQPHMVFFSSCVFFAYLKSEAYNHHLSYILNDSNCSKVEAVSEYSEEFFAIKKEQFLTVLLNAIINKGHSFENIKDVDEETRNAILEEASIRADK